MDTSAKESATTPYELPRIEVVLTPEELEREILYAGQVPSFVPDFAL